MGNLCTHIFVHFYANEGRDHAAVDR